MKKFAYLEGLRGIAALIVVFHHLILMFFPVLNYGENYNSVSKYISISPLNIFYNGDCAVCLFFVLSGYVLSYKYLLTNDFKIPLGYAVKRYFRLLPLIAVSVIFAFLFIRSGLIHTTKLDTITHSGNWLTDLFKIDSFSFTALFKNIFYGILFIGDNQYNPVVWSMKIEFISSLLLFAFLLAGHKIKYKWILFSVAFAVSFYLHNFYDIAFLFGYGLCYLNINNKIKINSTPLKISLLLIALITASYPAAWQYWNTSIYSFMTFKAIDLYVFYHVLGSALLLLLIIQHPPSKFFLNLKPILFLGKISFPMYLFHLVLLLVITAPLFELFLPLLGYYFAVIISVLITFPCIILISFLANNWIDKPALRFANKIESWFLGSVFKKNNLIHNKITTLAERIKKIC